jgi:hypothetical protein
MNAEELEKKIFDLLKEKLSKNERVKISDWLNSSDDTNIERSVEQAVINLGRSNIKNRFNEISKERVSLTKSNKNLTIGEIKSQLYQKAAFMNPTEIPTNPLPINPETITDFLDDKST